MSELRKTRLPSEFILVEMSKGLMVREDNDSSAMQKRTPLLQCMNDSTKLMRERVLTPFLLP